MSNVEAFASRLKQEFADERVKDAGVQIDRYFSSEPLTGSRFELLADDENPNEITARDLVAVSMLNVTIPPSVAVWLLSDEGRRSVSALLREIPTDLDLWHDDAKPDPASPQWQLYDLLGSANWPSPSDANQMGPAKKSKLLAAKRPRLVPISDSVVRENALPDVGDEYWMAWHLAPGILRHGS